MVLAVKERLLLWGAVERGGGVKTQVLKYGRQTGDMLSMIMNNIEANSTLYTDQYGIYRKTKKMGYNHQSVNHWKKEFGRGQVHTNTIEGFWAQLKRGVLGTYNGAISPGYLQSYINEFSFRYGKPSFQIFEELMARI